jgi:hypothetical protein
MKTMMLASAVLSGALMSCGLGLIQVPYEGSLGLEEAVEIDLSTVVNPNASPDASAGARPQAVSGSINVQSAEFGNIKNIPVIPTSATVKLKVKSISFSDGCIIGNPVNFTVSNIKIKLEDDSGPLEFAYNEVKFKVTQNDNEIIVGDLTPPLETILNGQDVKGAFNMLTTGGQNKASVSFKLGTPDVTVKGICKVRIAFDGGKIIFKF